MCGRFALIHKPGDIEDHFALADVEDFPARYNIAPTQPILLVTAGFPRRDGSNLPARRSFLVRWGLIPGWAKNPKEIPLHFNARSETAAGKAAFKAAMRHRRALVPASGFYEWNRDGAGKGQPYWVRPRHGGVFAFAGLFETWMEPGGSEIDTGAILTAAATGPLAAIHHRVPVVVEPRDFDRWLDCRHSEPREVFDLLKPPAPDFFEAIPVSDKVNKVANVGPELIEPVAAATEAKPLPAGGQLSLF
jgi:putative SOS response-associated peptidase YedK